jgi:hypothetical protein
METTQSADETIAYDRTDEGPATVLVVRALCDRQTTKTLTTLLADRFTAAGGSAQVHGFPRVAPSLWRRPLKACRSAG